MKNAQQNICLRIGEDDLKKWQALCSQSGISAQEGIRRAINDSLSRLSAEPTSQQNQITPDESEKLSMRVHVHFTPSDFAAAQGTASKLGTTIPKLCRRSMRATVYGSRLLSEEGVKVIQTSNYLLQKIGNNLNNVARHLNWIRKTGGKYEKSMVSPEFFTELSRLYMNHTQQIKRFIFQYQR